MQLAAGMEAGSRILSQKTETTVVIRILLTLRQTHTLLIKFITIDSLDYYLISLNIWPGI